jgi:hypothetical protein
LDTRSKILTLPEITDRRFETIVMGYFDPVVAGHVERLASLAPVTVSLLDPPDEILPLRARAELVAALAGVVCVILGDARSQAQNVIDFTREDLETRAALIDRIRQRSASPVV